MAEADALLRARVLNAAGADHTNESPLFHLPSDPPAIADFLVHRGQTTRNALPATVIDLSARGHFETEELSVGSTLFRFALTPPRERLNRFEQRVISLMRDHAANGTVPAEALTLGIEDERASWWHAFSNEVAREARTLKYTRGKGSMRWLVLAFSGVPLIVLLVSGAIRDSGVARLIVALAIASLVAVTFYTDTVTRADLTISGRRAAKQWRTIRRELEETQSFNDEPAAGVVLWGRLLAYATALGLAPKATHELPIGPDRAHSVSVVRGATWQHIPVTYPLRFPPGWGRHPVVAALIGGTATAVAIWLLVVVAGSGQWHPEPPFSSGAADVIGDLEPLIAGLALALLPFSAWQMVNGILDVLGPARDVSGTVVARWVRQGRRYNPWADLVPRYWYVAVDDGDAASIRGWRIPEEVMRGVHRGALVTAELTPRLGHVRSFEVVDG